MRELGITRRYVKALFDLAMEGGVTAAKRVLTDLHWFDSVLVENDMLRQYLCDPRVSIPEKKDRLAKILPDDLQDTTVDFLLWVTERGRAALIPKVAAEYEDLLQDHQGVAVAEVESAARLDSETRDALIAKLEEVSGRKVKLVESVEPELIGGLRIRLGSQLYDGSVRRQLQDMREELLRIRLPVPAPLALEELEVSSADDAGTDDGAGNDS